VVRLPLSLCGTPCEAFGWEARATRPRTFAGRPEAVAGFTRSHLCGTPHPGGIPGWEVRQVIADILPREVRPLRDAPPAGHVGGFKRIKRFFLTFRFSWRSSAMTKAKDSAHPISYPTLLSEYQASAFLSITRRCIQDWRLRGTGPKYYRLGRSVRYVLSDLQQWFNECLVVPGSAEIKSRCPGSGSAPEHIGSILPRALQSTASKKPDAKELPEAGDAP